LARKILLADDSVTAQNMGRKILVDAGYEVVTVNNGSAALKRVNESKPDLVVLDVYMPGYSGLEVCQRLKETPDTAHIPVLLTVGKLEPFKPDEARRARADAHIVKPFEASELLSALARLEDRVVPSADEPKLRRKGAGDNGQAKAGTDTSWKDRLRFPSPKKKKEAEPEPAEGTDNFHDFRSKGKPASEPPAAAKTTKVEREPHVLPDIPRDITADELDALSALAASLDAKPTENETPAAEQTHPAETMDSQFVKAADFVQQPAPVDREDEPAFAVAPAVREEKVEAETNEAVATSELAVVPEPAEAKADEPNTTQSKTGEGCFEMPRAEVPTAEEPAVAQFTVEPALVEEPRVEGLKVDEPKADVAAIEESRVEAATKESAIVDAATETTTTVTSQETIHAEATPPEPASVAPESVEEGPAPSDEELAQALRLLTPATGSEASMPSHDALVAAGSLLAEEAARAASSAWVAESVPLSQEEASISLEAEMFGSFASGGFGAILSEVATSQSRLTETPMAEGQNPEALSTPDSSVGAGSITEPVPATGESVLAPEQAPAYPFADAGRVQETEGAYVQAETAHTVQLETAASFAAPEVGSEDSSPDTGGQEDMGKRGTETSGRAGKRRSGQMTPVSAEGAATEVAGETAETPKAMAAAASADGGSSPLSDASAIASIVDSVLADLRPKIVEEIAKKLAKK